LGVLSAAIALLVCDHAHDVALLHDQELCAIDLDLGARPLAEQDAVAFPEVQRDNLAILAASAGPYGNDLALLRLLGGGIGNDDAPGGLGFAVDAAQGHAIVEGTKFHFLGSNAVNPARGRGAFGCVVAGSSGCWHSR